MSDFITMQCPNCGGKLSIGTGTLTLACEHCGTEHMVRRGSEGIILESYARCPLCNRNDRAEKVSAILRSQTHTTNGVAYQEVAKVRQVGDQAQTITERVAVPVRTSQTSELVHLLMPPEQPTSPEPVGDASVRSRSNKAAKALFVLGVVLVSIGLVGTSSSAVIVGVTLLAIGVFGEVVRASRERMASAQKKEQIENRRKALQDKHQREMAAWTAAMARWEQLYYCRRDDCVFVPGTNTSAPVTQMREYISRPEPGQARPAG